MNNDACNDLVEQCAAAVPSNWCDHLLSGRDAPKLPLDGPAVERLLRGVAARIREMKVTEPKEPTP